MAKKKKAPEQPTTRLFVEVDSVCEHYEQSDEEWGGSWQQDNSAEVTGVLMDNDKRVQHLARGEWITIPGTVADGDKVYVLFMLYSSGDSFGSSSGNHDVLWVFTDLDTAKAALEVVKSANGGYNVQTGSNSDTFTLEFKLENGATQKVHNPAAGYFEGMEDVYLKEMVVGDNGGTYR
jgi:hypothetical protein